ncbi:MAG: hypothetical protein J0J04_04765 [Microbacterium sp.]|uniref:hypothetical protein n=1 Tax=Microbacterium sp. TaxID=51671 RepID=UPI001AC73415|nr:hypothetical protein [Microbacterium sp.]MBN9214120.1 hypothetical protein [Microbacterium sp.]
MDNPTTTTRWTVDDYADAGIIYSGARKLGDSAVAPLVAQARGYYTVMDHTGAKEVAGLIYTTKGHAAAAKRLATMTNNGNDFMVIPWHSAGDVLREGVSARSASTQVRPSSPLDAGDGKVAKYETLPGHPSVIDLHPSVAAPWFNGASRLLITEGVLKGDSVLTAQLLQAGITREELAAKKDLDKAGARHLLAALLDRVPQIDRVPVLSLIGVGNWRQNPEWNSMNIRDRKVLVAFDGDVATKRAVWQQAEKMFLFLEDSKKAIPQLLDLGGLNARQFLVNAGFDESKKVGIDDFLAEVGTWSDALKLIEPTLPAEPKAAEDEESEWRPGDWRINQDGISADRFKQVGVGDNAYFMWERNAVRLGGRLKSNTSLRTATDADVEDGLAHPGTVVRSGAGEVVYEISWCDKHGIEHTRNVRGSQALLNQLPSEWYKTEGTEIDSLLAEHPDWPPRREKGEGWLAAVKDHRSEETDRSEGWDTMGWVPSASGHPVYIVGGNVLAQTEEEQKANLPGVTEETLAKSSFYGVNDSYGRLVEGKDDLGAWRSQVAGVLREVVDAFTDGAAHRNPVVGPILLACGLRPTAPTSTSVQLFLSGGPGSGKSWFASFMMGFWQSRPGVWNETHLPGSANDTVAAIEYARARTPFWVIDDLAPGASRQESERMESAIDNSIRQGFNRSGKRRSSAEGKQQKVSVPRALTVYTAENQRDNLSIRQRSIDIRFQKGDVLNDGAKRIQALTKRHDNPMAQLTAAMIRFWLNVPIEETPLPDMRAIDLDDLDLNTWAGKHQLALRIIARSKSDIQDLLSKQYGLSESESARRAGVFSELLFTLDVLFSLGVWAGIDPDDEVLARLAGNPDEAESLHGALVAYAAEDLREFRTKSNSRSLLEAIKNALQQGEAHLANPVAAGEPPVPATHWNAQALNQALGWTYDSTRGAWMPKGKPIGFAGQPDVSKPEEWIAALNTTNAFALAQRHYPNLVPHGQKAVASWNQVWEDENGTLVSPRYTRPTDRGVGLKVKLGDGAGARLRGIPVQLAVLLDGGESDLVE